MIEWGEKRWSSVMCLVVVELSPFCNIGIIDLLFPSHLWSGSLLSTMHESP